MTIHTEYDLVSTEELLKAYGYANFGGMEPREVVRQGVLKCASGFYQGRTSMTICKDLGLITGEYELTTKGKAFLWAVFSTNPSV